MITTIRRSRGGCWTCRQRRRKCDEAKPVCNVCQSRNLCCGGYELRLSEFHTADGHSGQMKCKILRGSSPSGPLSHRSRRQSPPTRAVNTPRTLLAKQDAPNATSVAPGELPSGEEVVPHVDLRNGKASSNEEIDPPATQEAESLTIPDVLVSHENTVTSLAAPALETQSYPEPSNGQAQTWHNFALDSWSGSDAQNFPGTNFIPPLDLSHSPQASSDFDFLGPINMEIGALEENDSREAIDAEQDQATAYDTHNLDLDVLDDNFVPMDEEQPQCPVSGNANSQVSLSIHGQQPDSFDFNALLLQHFFNVLAPKFCPAHPHHNPYTTVYGTLAFIFRPLRNAVLRAAALHLQHSGQLTLDLSTRFNDHTATSGEAARCATVQRAPMAATIMLSILCEIIGSSSKGWISKLIQARKLLNGSNFQDEHAPELQFLRLHFNWMVAISWSMRSSVIPSREMEQLEFIIEEETPKNVLLRDQVDWFCNLPDHRLSAIFWDVTRLSRRLYINTGHNPQIPQQLMPDVADLIHRTNLCYPSSSTATDPHSSYSDMVNSVWRNGIMCYIYSDVCLLPSSDARMQECVRLGSEALERLPWIQHVIWPAVMTGVHAFSEAHRNIYMMAFAAMSFNLHFLQGLPILDFLGKVWAELDGRPSQPACWRSVLHETGIQLNVFL